MVRQAKSTATPDAEASAAAEPPKTRRGRPNKTPEQSESVADLIKAIAWIDVAQRDDQLRPVYETHSRIFQGWIIATDGTITAGHKIALDGDFAPNTAKLLAALSKVGANLSMTYQDGRLALTSKGFKCAVPCLPGSTVQVTYPAPQMGPATDALAKALGSVGRMVKSSGQTVLETSVMLTGHGTALATDRSACPARSASSPASRRCRSRWAYRSRRWVCSSRWRQYPTCFAPWGT